jgi:4-amino-4-deoxy-L-arabinose transferase-like glycosyltransferase
MSKESKTSPSRARTASRRRPGGPILLAAAFCIYLGISLFYVVFGQVQIDEACYLYSGQLVYRGEWLYHDFLYIQTPVLPYIYGLSQLIAGGSIYAGRLMSVLFGILNFILAVRLAGKLWGPRARIITACLFAFNPFLIFFFSTVKVYALPSFFLLLGLTFWFSRIRGGPRIFLTMVFLSLAMGTRFSFMVAPALFLFYLFFIKRVPLIQKGVALAGMGLVLTVIFLPFLLIDPARMIYDFVGFHLDIKLGSLATKIMHKLAATRRMAGFLFFFFALLCAAYKVRRWRLRALPALFRGGADVVPYLWLIVVLIFIGHYRAGFVQESYNIVLFPLAVVLVSGPLARFYEERKHPGAKRLLVILFLCGCLLSAFFFGRTSLVYREGRTSVQYAQSLADLIAEKSGPEDEIISSDTALMALLSGRELRREFVNCEYYAYWTTKDCRRFRVVNDDILLSMIRSRAARIFIFNELSFTNEFPTYSPLDPAKKAAIVDTLEMHYDLLLRHPNVFDMNRWSYIYVRKNDDT